MLILKNKIISFFLTPVFFIIKKVIRPNLTVIIFLLDLQSLEPRKIFIMKLPLPLFQLLSSHILFIGSFLMVKNVKQSILLHISKGFFSHYIFFDKWSLTGLQLDGWRGVVILRQGHIILAVF